MNRNIAHSATPEEDRHASSLLDFYEAIEAASQDMLEAARNGDWDTVVRLEGACALLIAQLKHAAHSQVLASEEVTIKSRIMQRILRNDAEIRHLAEPWIHDLSRMTGHPDGGRLH